MGVAGGRWRREGLAWLWVVPLLGLLVWGRQLLVQALAQLASGGVVALLALPLMRLLEKHLKPSAAAALSLLGLGAALVAAVVLLAPALLRQLRQLLVLLPQAAQRVTVWLSGLGQRLRQAGLPLEAGQTLLAGGEEWLGSVAPALLGWAQAQVGSISRWMLAPLFAFYFLRDRQPLGRWALLLVPVGKRGFTLQLLREIRREIAGYLRGQLLLSLSVGGLTAVGLLLCGIPAWLALGTVMGVLELIPYAGPLLGAGLVALFGLQSGTGRMLWGLAVVLVVQQLESNWLSPKVMSNATRLHPMAVVLSLLLGGSAAGVAGMLLAVPLVLCLRAVLRVWCLSRCQWQRQAEAIMKER